VIPDHKGLKGKLGLQDKPGLRVQQGLRVNPVLPAKQDRRDRHP
jgi:hypothetical protein